MDIPLVTVICTEIVTPVKMAAVKLNQRRKHLP